MLLKKEATDDKATSTQEEKSEKPHSASMPLKKTPESQVGTPTPPLIHEDQDVDMEGEAEKEDGIKTPEPDEEEEERELVEFLLKMKERKDEEFATELPVKLRTVMRRFYDALTGLPKDEYGDLVFDSTSNSKITGLLRRRGRTLKRILTFLEPDPKIIIEEEGSPPEEKEVQTDIEGLVTEQAFAEYIGGLVVEAGGRKGSSRAKRRNSRSPKDRSHKITPLGEKKLVREGSRKTMTQIKAFKFKNKMQGNLRIHPYQRLLANLLKKVEGGLRFGSELSVRFLLKQMVGIYGERLAAGKESVAVRNQRLGDFFYDFTLHKYGLSKVTDKKISEVVLSTALHRKKIPDVELVAR